MTVITSQVNAQVYIEMRSGNASCHRAEDEKSFFQGRQKLNGMVSEQSRSQCNHNSMVEIEENGP